MKVAMEDQPQLYNISLEICAVIGLLHASKDEQFLKLNGNFGHGQGKIQLSSKVVHG